MSRIVGADSTGIILMMLAVMKRTKIWIYSSTEPEEVETIEADGQKQRIINFHIEKIPETQDGFMWRYKRVILEPWVWSYEAIVEALLNYRFTEDKREAIILNYLYDSEEDANDEMEDLQQWRKEAKMIARKCFFLFEPL